MTLFKWAPMNVRRDLAVATYKGAKLSMDQTDEIILSEVYLPDLYFHNAIATDHRVVEPWEMGMMAADSGWNGQIGW